MVNRVAHLGGNIAVGRVSHGLMMMCFPVGGKSDEDCFESIKAGVDALPAGAKAFLNAGEFYSSTGGTENLELLARFYAKYPDYADKTFISVKGGIVRGKRMPDCSMDNLRRSVETITKALGPLKKLDLYEPARIDPNVPVEDMMQSLAVLLKEGHFTHIGLSECSAKTLRRAHAVYPVTAVEIEVSLWSYEQETKDVIATAAELGVAVAAYSPIGRGFLIGKIKSRADFAEGDFRAGLSRLSDENIDHNLRMVEEILAIAENKGVTPAQLCIAWVAALGPHVIPLPGSSKAERTLENLQGGDVELKAQEVAELTAIAERGDVKGGRYFGGAEMQYLWG
ncbi:aldo/keto reductase [Roridomyces roridus]|uniref:Aldo/keto reductase n=1 Tax=Roridomyces roridus TaxID=1738132 RepID=A0AAD7FMK5_9AGAR|nr:aldo/keto reductase [Roridomyces roridus]